MLTEKSRKFSPSPILRRTFIHAANVCASLSAQAFLDEETLSGTLLGALSATLPLLATAKQEAGGDVSTEASLEWRRYLKASASNKDSEAVSGADFALVLVDANKICRIAVFQAKKSKPRPEFQERRAFDLRHEIKLPDGSKSTQMVALVRASIKIMAPSRSNDLVPTKKDWETFKWVHYLVYTNETAQCIPLSSLEEHYDRELNRTGPSQHFVPVDTEGKAPLHQVFTSGIKESTSHWLTLDSATAASSLPGLRGIIPVLLIGSTPDLSYLIEIANEAEADAEAACGQVENFRESEAHLPQQPIDTPPRPHPKMPRRRK